MVFNTNQLCVRNLSMQDQNAFFDLMRNPKVVIYTPSNPLNRNESDAKLDSLMNTHHHFWAVELKDTQEFIGIGGLKIVSDSEAEIAYSIREKFWRNGYGTEIAQGLIKYAFQKTNYTLLTAYADPKNRNSLKILEKFMQPIGEVYSEEYQCIDMKYELNKNDWVE